MNKERRLILKGLGSCLVLASTGLLAPVVYGEETIKPKTLICPIHYLHEVNDRTSFEYYIAGLINNNYFPVALRDIADYFNDNIQVWPEDKDPIAITFDDGLLSQLKNAVPILEKWRLRATFPVMTDYADGVHDYMEHQQLKEISDQGMEVAAHGLDMHQSLPILYNQNRVAWKRNIVDVKTRLEEIIEKEVVSFAYPNGSYDQRTMDLVYASGYKIAVRTGGNYPELSSSTIFELPRVSVPLYMSISA